MEEEVRVTILGHVQRGGAPSAYDRLMGTLLGHAAVHEVLAAGPGSPPQLVGVRHNRITRQPLAECVEATAEVYAAIISKDSNEALRLRGGSFSDNIDTLQTLLRSLPNPPSPGQRRLRLAVLSSGGPAPGMNTATRAAVRLALDEGHADARRSRRFSRADRRRHRGARLDERPRLDHRRRLRARDQPHDSARQGLLRHRPQHRGPRDRRHPDDRRLVGL